MVIKNTDKMTRNERRKVITREAIITAALKAFKEIGFANTTVENIMERADLGYGTFYQYFSNKQELLNFLADQVINSLESYVVPKEKVNVMERLLFGVKGYLKLYISHQEIIFALKEAMTVDRSFEEKWEQIRVKLQQRVEHDIVRSMKKGYCREVNHSVAILAIVSMMEGLANHVVTINASPDELDKVAESLTDLIYYAVFKKD